MSYFQSVDSLILTGATVAIALATVVLVVVTWRYAKATAEIVKEMRQDRVEMQKDRRMQYIERRLEKLYYPIQKILLPTNILPPLEISKAPFKLPEIIMTEAWNYQYLGSEKLREQLHKLRDNYLFMKPNEAYSLCKEILEIVEDDIPKILKELNELVD